MSALPIVRNGDYAVSAAGFMIKGYRREHPTRIKALLFPSFEPLRHLLPQELSITREWAASQLMHIGIPMLEGQDEIQALSDAIKAGLVSYNFSVSSAGSDEFTDRSQSARRGRTRSDEVGRGQGN
jgi:hypothetical protein